jgi:hypothetical protein
MTLGTEADLVFGEDGVTCRIVIPLGPRPARATPTLVGDR